ncbi:Ribosome maturation factor rimM [Aerococcus viridans]|uniref:Ribosome maturation factor RimM n=2 Tax=Aerococcus viridans TaxID=1377 RepID=A0AAU8U5I0_9LACT|nr:ribosome maturation factor RimM [Aerococcus viridans]AMC01302.1 ribosome maturation factor RimM [Aerococcus viridans]EFG49678.1 16S rRNA processing protein RimM [Aerococcus viridans ATCC 11563 = CCUG 4311]SUU16223.1 Ribosome maturation factor rimM [Aerococcus viridans]
MVKIEGMAEEQYYLVGKIVNTQALRGEVRVMATTDFPEERFRIGATLAIFNGDKLVETVEVDGHRLHKNFNLLHFKGKDNINDVEKFKGFDLKVAGTEREADELDENEFYYDDIIGLEVYTTDETYLGKVREITSLPSNDVWAIQRPNKGKDILIPYIEDIVLEIDLDDNRVVIDPMDGLIDDVDAEKGDA